MARASQFAKLNRSPSSPCDTATAARCAAASRGYYREFELCRICLRLLALRGETPRRDQGELVIAMMTDPIADMLTRIRNASHGPARPRGDAALAA